MVWGRCDRLPKRESRIVQATIFLGLTTRAKLIGGLEPEAADLSGVLEALTQCSRVPL